MVKPAAGLYIELRATLEKFQQQMNGAAGTVIGAEKKISGAFKTVQRVAQAALVIGGVAAVKRLGAAITDLARKGEEAGSIKDAFKQLGGTASSIEEARKASLGLVDSFDLMQIANKGLLKGIPDFNKQFGTLAATAAKLADAFGKDTTEVLDDLVKSMTKGRATGLVKELGIAAPSIEAYVEAAKKLKPVNDSVANAADALSKTFGGVLKQVGIGINSNEGFQQALRGVDEALRSINWEAVGSAIGSFINFAIQATDVIADFGEMLVNYVVKQVDEFFTKLADSIVITVVKWNDFWADFGKGIDAINAGIDIAIVKFIEFKDKAIEAISALVEGVREWMVNKLQEVWEDVGRGIDVVKGFFSDMYEAVVGHSYVPDMIDRVGDEFDRLQPEMVDTTQTATINVTEAFGNMSNTVSSFVSNVGNVVEAVFGGGGSVISSIQSTISTIESAISIIGSLMDAWDAASAIIGIMSSPGQSPGGAGGGGSGIIGGATAGAGIGTAVAGPGIGTGVGAVIGAIGGAFGVFAKGGVFNKPTLGVFGEAGPEAILPLKNINGRMGVVAEGMGGGMSVYIDARGADAGVEHRLRNAIKNMGDMSVRRAVNSVMDISRRGGRQGDSF